MKNDFMLQGPTAERLYAAHAKNAPIYDYHCHLSAQEIHEDRIFDNISSMWLKHDHYKWRTMRFAGVPERYVTGDGSDADKFRHFAKTAGRLVGSPIYHWSNMELSTYFGVEEALTEKNWEAVYDRCNRKIREESLSPVKIILNSNVKLICTTDDPTDSLEHHILLKEKGHPFQVLPTFRPDKALAIRKPGWTEYLKELEKASGISIGNFRDLADALVDRIGFFHSQGCVLADHSLESLLETSGTLEDAEAVFQKAVLGMEVDFLEGEIFRNQLLVLLAGAYAKNNWAMQLHIGALRNNNSRWAAVLGPDAGFDVMNDFPVARPLAALLDAMDGNGGLPNTILYTLNDKDNLVLSTLPHCFSIDSVPGKVQFGSAWWFNDHKQGMLDHFTTLANQGMLADFVGMLTDSRSFLSYARHDYFRRILCSFLGTLVDEGEFHGDPEILGGIVEDICSNNIRNYLGL
ncbi:glucuronate isomerase [Anaerotalea alkaliphila]|uniref:glucuronate isomerase n=1 Tax=Anaerotalea alkaliphila TaxID=2662126 RepID=UPI001FE5CE37|nr:glucuronate isomerase [Anaerotalea alkaliphila]